MDEREMMYRSMMWRVILTLLIVGVALVGSLGYVAFYATGFSLFQSVVLVLIALIIAGLLVSIIWMVGWSRYMNKKTWAKFKEWKE